MFSCKYERAGVGGARGWSFWAALYKIYQFPLRKETMSFFGPPSPRGGGDAHADGPEIGHRRRSSPHHQRHRRRSLSGGHWTPPSRIINSWSSSVVSPRPARSIVVRSRSPSPIDARPKAIPGASISDDSISSRAAAMIGAFAAEARVGAAPAEPAFGVALPAVKCSLCKEFDQSGRCTCDAAIAVNEQAPQTQRLPSLPRAVVNEIKAEAEALIRQGVTGTSAYLTSILIASFYGEGKTLGEFLNKFYNVEDMRTLPRGDRRFIAVYNHVNALRKEISNRSVAPSEAGALGGAAEFGEAADLPEAGVGGDAEMVEVAYSGDARPLTAAKRAPRTAYVQFTAEHKQFATAWIRENYIRAITEWTQQNRTGTPSTRALMTPNYTEANYIDAMKAHFGDLNVNWSALKKAAVIDLAGELEQQMANPNVKLIKTANFNTTRAPNEAQDAQVDEQAAVPLGDAGELTQHEAESDAEMDTESEVPTDTPVTPNAALADPEPESYVLNSPLDGTDTYRFIAMPPDYRGDVISDIGEFMASQREFTEVLPKYAFDEFQRTVHLIKAYDEWLRSFLYTLYQLIQKLDIKPSNKSDKRLNISQLPERYSVRGETLTDSIIENYSYYYCLPATKPVTGSEAAQKADAYSLWFHPILELIKDHTLRPAWIRLNLEYLDTSFKAWVDNNVDLVDDIGMPEVASLIVSLNNYISDSSQPVPKIKEHETKMTALVDLLYQLDIKTAHVPDVTVAAEIAKLWFPDDDREFNKAYGRLKGIEEEFEDSLVTLIGRLEDPRYALSKENDSFVFSDELVERDKTMFGDMVVGLLGLADKKPRVVGEIPLTSKVLRNKIVAASNSIEEVLSGWADQAARLTQRIVSKRDEELLQNPDVDQFERIRAAYDPKYCYVKSGRTLPDTRQQTGSVVQKTSAKNAVEAYSKNQRCILYNWATGTGKTSAIWCEIFAAVANDVEYAYISLVRWGTAQDIFSNIVGAMGANHIKDIAIDVFGEDCTIQVTPSVTAYYKKNKKDVQEGLSDSRVWSDDKKMVLEFDVTINSKTIRVYLSRLIDWASLTVPETVIDKDDDNKELRRYEWKGKVIEEVLTPILQNHPRIFIVDEAHEIRINDAVANFGTRRVIGDGEESVFEYLHDENDWRKEAPSAWGTQSNCVLCLIRGDITPLAYSGLADVNNLVRCAYLTATPIAQHWKDFIDFLSSMYAVTNSNSSLSDLYDRYSGTTGLRTIIKNKITTHVKEPVEKAMKETKGVNQTTKVKALKKGREIIMEMLNTFGVKVSLDLFSTVDMPYTNYSMTSTGIGYKGLTLTQNTPIKVTLDATLSRFHALMNEDEIWDFADPDLREWTNLLYKEPVPNQPIAKTSKTNNASVKADMKNRFTCAIYCFRDPSYDEAFIPFPISSDSFNNLHVALFDIEKKMFDDFKTVHQRLTGIIASTDRETRTATADTLQIIFAVKGSNLDNEMRLLKTIYAFAYPNEVWTPTQSMDEYRRRWAGVVRQDRWGFNPDIIRCICPKLDMIARAVKENTLSPSMVYFIQNGFGGSDHLAMILDALDEPIKLIQANKTVTDSILQSQEIYKERCVIMNGDATPTERDSITNEDTGLFNDDRNAHGKIIRCIIFVSGSAASITLRNVLVCHYPIDDYFVLRYVQSLGRIARRSAFSQGNGKLKLFGFTATETNPEGHNLIKEEDDSSVPETVDEVNDVFVYNDGSMIEPFDKTGLERTPGQYNMITRIPVCSYITYRIALSEIPGLPEDMKRSSDDRIAEISLSAGAIYTIIQLALATLSQNCSTNSQYFARITGNATFETVCATTQKLKVEDIQRDIEQRTANLAMKRMEKRMSVPGSDASQLKDWVKNNIVEYFTKARSGQSVLTEARNKLGKRVLTPKWTKKEVTLVLKILAKDDILKETSSGEFRPVKAKSPLLPKKTVALDDSVIKKWVAEHPEFFKKAKGETALHTQQAIKGEQPLRPEWTAEKVAEVLRTIETLQEIKPKQFKLKEDGAQT